jgi:hypothetical protein
MTNELSNAINSINIENLDEGDKEDLLRIFIATKDAGVRNRIAMLFADLRYEKAVSYIVKKINDPSIMSFTGTLLYALDSLNAKKHFLTFIRVLCEHEYESQYEAYGLVEKYADSISQTTREKAIGILYGFRTKEEHLDEKKYENSKLHFIDATIRLLLGVD